MPLTPWILGLAALGALLIVASSFTVLGGIGELPTGDLTTQEKLAVICQVIGALAVVTAMALSYFYPPF